SRLRRRQYRHVSAANRRAPDDRYAYPVVIAAVGDGAIRACRRIGTVEITIDRNRAGSIHIVCDGEWPARIIGLSEQVHCPPCPGDRAGVADVGSDLKIRAGWVAQ